jgi:DNA invertase Pin-like site-specific DNA recombinase
MNQYALYARKSQEDEGRQQQSIGDQVRIMTDIAQRDGLDVVVTLTEQRSAKRSFARPVFGALMKRVEEGTVNSILCYNVNRLTRNMAEGGLLQDMLTEGKLREIRTYGECFRSGDNILPFVLQAAMSTQYSLDLSQHVKRGMASKVQKGGYPGRAPEGYVNNLFDHSIEADPERFSVIRRAWDLMLTGSYSISQIVKIMDDEWGYRTRPARKVGGRRITRSGLHRLFHLAFYTGDFHIKGELYKGSHPAMITWQEYWAVQAFLGRHGNSRAKSREFAFTGLIRCAKCGRQVTAEHKLGRHRRGNYVYYHCAGYGECGSRAVREEVLAEQINCHLKSVAIDPQFRDEAVAVVQQAYTDESEKEHATYEQQNRAIEETQRRMSKLIKMAVSDMIGSDEFLRVKQELQGEINKLKQTTAGAEGRLEHARSGALEVAHFVTSAPFEFVNGDISKRREIARNLGVTYKLRDGVLEMELNPILAPLYHRDFPCSSGGPIEPPKTGSGSTDAGVSDPTVPIGWPVGTMFEPLGQVWDLLLAGAPRLAPAIARGEALRPAA